MDFIVFIMWMSIYLSTVAIGVSSQKNLQENEIKPKLKYILQWTRPDTVPFIRMGNGQTTFLQRKCEHKNCFVTFDRAFLRDLTEFDAILFHGPEVREMKNSEMPPKRSPTQKYVFVSIESAHYYPICKDRFNGFFNWTWTYKLHSDLPYRYFIVKNGLGQIIGPKTEMHWPAWQLMNPTIDKVKNLLKHKSRAAAWFVSNCVARSYRDEFIRLLQKEMLKFNLTIDIYGNCSAMKCPYENLASCLELLDRHYYFYFAMENSFDEDYVTEKLLYALQHFTVPVVYGSANYTRFMPEEAYLDALALGPKLLAQTMRELIDDKEKYFDMFRWQNHYSYHDVEDSPETDPYCKLCEIINNERLISTETVYVNFKHWWNPPALKCFAHP